jgi:cation transporter-like permease
VPSTTAEPSDIPALGNAYNHARKAYGLTSALLMAWELIGVELEATPVESLKLTLKSPQAAPYVLIVLVIYFGFRMTIEWYQTDARRRQLRASKVDLAVAHCIAGASLALYAYQTLSQVQLANAIPQNLFVAFVTGFAVGQVLSTVIGRRGLRDTWDEDWFSKISVLFAGAFMLFVVGWMLYSVAVSKDFRVLLIAATGVAAGAGLTRLLNRIVRRFH